MFRRDCLPRSGGRARSRRRARLQEEFLQRTNRSRVVVQAGARLFHALAQRLPVWPIAREPDGERDISLLGRRHELVEPELLQDAARQAAAKEATLTADDRQ